MKKSVVVLSIFFTLSLSAMEESSAAPLVPARKDPRAWRDFTLNKFVIDKTTTVEQCLSECDLGRNHLMHGIAESAFLQDNLLTLLPEYQHHVVISFGGQQGVNFIVEGYNKIPAGHVLTGFCQVIARLEEFILKEGKNDEPYIQRELESTRRRHLILLSQALKHDALYSDIKLQDLPEHFKKNRKKWPPKEDTNGVYSRLSSYTVVRSALKKRIRNGIMHGHPFYMADAKSEK